MKTGRYALVAITIAALLLLSAPLLPHGRALDHEDGPAVTAAPELDLTDLYAWTTNGKVAVVLDVHPDAGESDFFPTTAQYIVHFESSAVFPGGGTPVDVIVEFDAQQNARVWVGEDNYVTGDARVEAGLVSDDGKIRVFTGRRNDPAFSNLTGFDAFREAVIARAASTDECEEAAAGDLEVLATTMRGDAPVDGYEGRNVLSIVLELDASLVAAGGPVLGVWASSHRRP